ncbi:PREDICTED: uncharacterized protein LOC108360979 [Rhagoletis zephyria]|uniref:uncharacterized protein LOC108360979 n=1 Tax=Rhagoletis zephyria TaxID=28612 RepID=UPI00081149C1|nr:PREDICTED: uncharacterized protein LOC108360979 [Rhagoletis zephyria]
MDVKKESPLYKTLQLWSDGESRLLLDRYAHYLPDIGPMKTLKNKKEMWIKIATEIEGKSPKQCEERYKTIVRRKKAAVENNNTSGAKRQKIDFEGELDEIYKLDDSIEPVIQISSQNVLRKISCNERVVKYEKKEKKTVQETLMEIAQNKEKARERRHKEKMNLIQNLLGKMVEDKKY